MIALLIALGASVICAADFVPRAALLVCPGGFPAAEAEGTLVTMLREPGVRFLRLRSDSLPRPAEMRALVPRLMT